MGVKVAKLFLKRKDGYLYLCLYIYVSIYTCILKNIWKKRGAGEVGKVCVGKVREWIREGASAARLVFHPLLTSSGAALYVNTCGVASRPLTYLVATHRTGNTPVLCRPTSGSFVSQGPWLSEVSPFTLKN